MKKTPFDDSILIRARAGDPCAVNDLIIIFTPKIYALISSFSYRTSDLREDCIQMAYICLLNCCSKYNNKISNNFFGYVMVSMKRSILNCLIQEATQTNKICVTSSTYLEFDVLENVESNYDLEEDVLEQLYIEKINLDMENGYYSISNVKLFKAICSSDFDIKTYAKVNDILISTLYKNILRLKEKIRIRLDSPNAGNGTKFELHTVVPISN